MSSVSTSPVLKDKAGGAIAINHVMFCLEEEEEENGERHARRERGRWKKKTEIVTVTITG